MAGEWRFLSKVDWNKMYDSIDRSVGERGRKQGHVKISPKDIEAITKDYNKSAGKNPVNAKFLKSIKGQRYYLQNKDLFRERK